VAHDLLREPPRALITIGSHLANECTPRKPNSNARNEKVPEPLSTRSVLAVSVYARVSRPRLWF